MNTGGFPQMSHNGFTSPPGMGMPAGGLASRRGGAQNIKPLSFDAIKSATDSKDTGVPTPRTSRGHLLAGLRTAPKTANPAYAPSPTTSTPPHMTSRNGSVSGNMYGAQNNIYSGPKTSMPRMASQSHQTQGYSSMGVGQQQQQQHQQPQQQQQQQHHPQYTTEQILAPPELHLDDDMQEHLDPNLYAQLVATNMYLAQQQQRLQQQLLSVQAAAQQFQGLSLNGHSYQQQQLALQHLCAQQQQLRNIQQSLSSPVPSPQNVFTYFDPTTGQQSYYVDQNTTQFTPGYMDHTPPTPQGFNFQQETVGTPRVQVSPPAVENPQPSFRTNSPPKKMEFTAEPEPLPPPSANAFRRGHKKTPSSLANNKGLALSSTEDGAKPAGPRTASFPLTPAAPGGYGPGQARAGDHPLRQPRGPPPMEELKAKPTSRQEGSKNFVARTRRSAVHNLVRAGMERRKGTGSSSGSMSPVSESAEETVTTPMTDNDSESGRSGSGSLSGDAEPSLASSRTSASISWGAIGSDRPSSRQKTRKSVDSLSSAGESENGSFASVFKNGGVQRVSKTEVVDGQRKAPMLVLTSAEKRKSSLTLV